MRKRESNRVDRRYAPSGTYTEADLQNLANRVSYAGSANHKLHPGNYGFVPPNNPLASKSVCDDLRSVSLEEATQLFASGIAAGMVSKFDPGGSPKYVWSVGDDGEVYEAKTKPNQETVYHGYRLRDDEETMRRYISDEWEKRCPKT